MKKGFTLVEILVVVFIFSFIIVSVYTFLTQSQLSFRIGQNKLIAQQEVRKAIEEISRLLRQSSPNWIINNTSYPLIISEQNKRVDFYFPTNLTLKKVTFKLNPDEPTQLLKKEGNSEPRVVANNITHIYFGGGCSSCSSYNCTTVSEDCPSLFISITTNITDINITNITTIEFNEVATITLRNINSTLNTTVEEYEEGLF